VLLRSHSNEGAKSQSTENSTCYGVATDLPFFEQDQESSLDRLRLACRHSDACGYYCRQRDWFHERETPLNVGRASQRKITRLKNSSAPAKRAGHKTGCGVS